MNVENDDVSRCGSAHSSKGGRLERENFDVKRGRHLTSWVPAGHGFGNLSGRLIYLGGVCLCWDVGFRQADLLLVFAEREEET